MAARLAQLRTKAVQVSELVWKHDGAYYKKVMEKNKQHVVQTPSVEKCQELSKQLFYTRLSRLLLLPANSLILVLTRLRLCDISVPFQKAKTIGILAFEVANTIGKVYNLMTLLSEHSMRHMKAVVLRSHGIQQLVSDDQNQLLAHVGTDIRDSKWHNLDKNYS
ncbi:hypothetical protein ABZP36_025957 [Zizania latifolia]